MVANKRAIAAMWTVIGCVAGLTACSSSTTGARTSAATGPPVASTAPHADATGSSSATATASTAVESKTSAAPLSIVDGTYRLAATPECGEFVVDGASLELRGRTAAVTAGGSAGHTVTGFISRNGKGFHIHVANGRVVVVDLTGTVSGAGFLAGHGQSGGVNMNAQTGWNCLFTFTATAGTAHDQAGQTLKVETFYSPSRNITCQILVDSVLCQSTRPPLFVRMSASGAFTTCSGTRCLGNAGENTPVLAYGETTLVGPFRCISATTGVTCTAGGQGFELSRAGVTKVP